MEDLYKVRLRPLLPALRTDAQAGGVPVILRELRPLLHLNAMTVTGQTLGDALDHYPPSFPQSIVRPMSDPLAANSSLVVLRGNLAPDGCVLKQSAMSPSLKQHHGRACVFKNANDMMARIDDPNLPVEASSVYVNSRHSWTSG